MLSIAPRTIYLNHARFSLTGLNYHPRVPAILQVCRESRACALEVRHYALSPICKLYLHPNLDTLAWMRHSGRYATFRRNCARILRCLTESEEARTQNSGVEGYSRRIPTFAISEEFWESIIKHSDCTPVYRALRLHLKFSTLLFIQRKGSFGNIDEHYRCKTSWVQDKWLDIYETTKRHRVEWLYCSTTMGKMKSGDISEEQIWKIWDDERVSFVERGGLDVMSPRIRWSYPGIVNEESEMGIGWSSY